MCVCLRCVACMKVGRLLLDGVAKGELPVYVSMYFVYAKLARRDMSDRASRLFTRTAYQ